MKSLKVEKLRNVFGCNTPFIEDEQFHNKKTLSSPSMYKYYNAAS